MSPSQIPNRYRLYRGRPFHRSNNDPRKSASYQRLADQLLRKHLWRCEFCGADARTVHHEFEVHEFPGLCSHLEYNSIRNLYVVCDKCHSKCHDVKSWHKNRKRKFHLPEHETWHRRMLEYVGN